MPHFVQDSIPSRRQPSLGVERIQRKNAVASERKIERVLHLLVLASACLHSIDLIPIETAYQGK
eukprot:scaffold37811_cov116-Skeletonema_marinoi.AAC.2